MYGRVRFLRRLICLPIFGFVWLAALADAQDRIKSVPGHDRFLQIFKEGPSSVKGGLLTVAWKEGGKSFDYRREGKIYRYDIASLTEKEVPEEKKEATGKDRPGGRVGGKGGFVFGLGRGRQFSSATSPDGALKAFCKERNLWLGDAKGILEMPITTDANDANRLKYGAASWVYGEELRQRTAIWWAPDSKKIAFYRFDESQIKDYYLTINQSEVQDKLEVEPYPKTGSPNPIPELLVYDVSTKKTLAIDVRDGKPYADDVVGHYVYGIEWSKEGKELLFHRTNRAQNILEFVAANPETGKCRVVIREAWPASWVENLPTMQFLKDVKRFIWASDRTGWRNLFLCSLDGSPPIAITDHMFDIANIVRIDEEGKSIFYLAHDGDNPMKLQLHRVGLDGQGDVRLTDPAFHHSVDMAPDGLHFVDTIQTHDTPPTTRLCNFNGETIIELAKSDTAKFEKLGLKKVELFQYKAVDGKTDLYGLLHKPTNFDPSKKYPLLVTVYAGPETNGARETFVNPSAITEYGFLVASLDSRSAAGRGKAILDTIYKKLGITEIDDQAAGVKALGERPYVDKSKVGIYGTSYGGTASILCLLRYPDLFHAASASSAVTDFRLYDTIYTERYLGKPQENKEAYDAGSCLLQANKLKGRLLLYYGTADNNVHPSNTLQMIRALQKAEKSFDVQVGPDAGHSTVPVSRMMEFFIENLGVK